MVKVYISVKASKKQNLSEKIPEIRKKGLKYSAQGMQRHLKQNSPVDEGLLKGWYFERESDTEVEIRTPAHYAPYVNDGTGIYNGGGIIRPKNGSVLRFKPGPKWKGHVGKDGYVYIKYSKGQKGQKFVEKSIQQTEGKLADYFIKAVHEVLT
ncbi:HK97 gp10 family phage protein [Methanobrevibacter sp.]|uniref:HK97 gp10 family phage protein n=1 Tax=Methanobrevibacter sp. TaxID=66852 RepID=UPI003867DB19